MALVQRAQRLERFEPLGARLADPDQDPAREGNPQLARERDRLEPTRRLLVRRGPVRAAPACEPSCSRLQHDPHRRRDRPQRNEVGAAHHAWIEVRQQPRLVEHELRDPCQILERRLAAERREFRPRDLVAELGLVAEREQRLGATGGRAGARDREHLLLGQERPLTAARRPSERAVAADVAAKRRQRDEDLRRVGDEPAAPPPLARRREQVVQRRLEQRLHRETLTTTVEVAR